LIIGLIGMWFYALYKPVVHSKQGFVYYLRPGMTRPQVITDLAEQNIIQFPRIFSVYVFFQKNMYLKTGEYLFPKGSTPVSIWQQMHNGKGLMYHHFAIIPGWTFAQIRRALGAQTVRQTTANLNDQQVMAQLGNPLTAPEGQFFPDTYYYTRGNTDFIILKHAFDLMQKKLNDAWLNRANNLPYKNVYEALILASLIEKEAYLDSERPIIAGVLLNRLKKNMLLQCDATVIYGLGNQYDGKIYKIDLTKNTLYNTYLHKGLPPTPIAMPSLNSIRAALHPQENDYFYYVAKKDHSHQFSKTLSEHHEAVKDKNLNESR
jgi:UPF0755 protein